jgi:hypothetical protein
VSSRWGGCHSRIPHLRAIITALSAWNGNDDHGTTVGGACCVKSENPGLADQALRRVIEWATAI